MYDMHMICMICTRDVHKCIGLGFYMDGGSAKGLMPQFIEKGLCPSLSKRALPQFIEKGLCPSLLKRTLPQFTEKGFAPVIKRG